MPSIRLLDQRECPSDEYQHLAQGILYAARDVDAECARTDR
jgi:hypothetical protein